MVGFEPTTQKKHGLRGRHVNVEVFSRVLVGLTTFERGKPIIIAYPNYQSKPYNIATKIVIIILAHLNVITGRQQCTIIAE